MCHQWVSMEAREMAREELREDGPVVFKLAYRTTMYNFVVDREELVTSSRSTTNIKRTSQARSAQQKKSNVALFINKMPIGCRFAGIGLCFLHQRSGRARE